MNHRDTKEKRLFTTEHTEPTGTVKGEKCSVSSVFSVVTNPSFSVPLW